MSDYSKCNSCQRRFDMKDGIGYGYEITLQKFSLKEGTLETIDSLHDGYICEECALQLKEVLDAKKTRR